MPRVIVQTDDGRTVDSHEFPAASLYALIYMPSCPTNMTVHNLLGWLRRALADAEAVQEGGDLRRLSERVMDKLAIESEHRA